MFITIWRCLARPLRPSRIALAVAVLAALYPVASSADPIVDYPIPDANPAITAGVVGRTSARTASTSCGEITARGERYLVRVGRGTVSCSVARYVIKHALTTSPASMGGPGQPPRGWQCGWNYYKFPHGDDVRAGAACARGASEVLGYWRPHLLHCGDVTAQSVAGTTFTAHDVWAYRLGCSTATNWIDTFFSSLANPSEEAFTGATYGCGEVSSNNAGCVGTSGTTGEVYFGLE